MNQLPCAGCGAKCCGPVPLSKARAETIRAYLDTQPPAALKRLQRQQRSPLDCAFLDMETHRCAVYPVRPWVCQALGRVPGLPCPELPGLVQIIPAIVVEMEMEKEYESGNAGLSNAVKWTNS